MGTQTVQEWVDNRIEQDEIDRYLNRDGSTFINDEEITTLLQQVKAPAAEVVEDIIAKALSITTLTPLETAQLLAVKDPEMWQRIFSVAGEIKKKVYDNRIVTFAPLYTGNLCVNHCLYCGFREDNGVIKRRMLTMDEIKEETKVLVGKIGHKRLIAVYGEHPATDIDYMVDSIKAMYSVSIARKDRVLNIRRVNVNAAPLPVASLRKLKEVGIGTYQVFQETYHRPTYEKVHPVTSLKGHYAWRLYCMHRALEAGVDDVGIGALFGMYDWRYEVMGLLYHARELEKKFNVGPHTISFPRLEPAANTPFLEELKYRVQNEDFKKVVAVLRLAVPHCGLIVTARENAQMRRDLIPLGCTQTDASTKIGIGAYRDTEDKQEETKQQFILGDMRSLDEVVRELAHMGYITSFCTAGYRCGRTGEHIMEMLRSGKEGVFCKLNAILTYREWIDDFASEETKKVAEPLIEKEILDVKKKYPQMLPELMAYYEKTVAGKRDLYF